MGKGGRSFVIDDLNKGGIEGNCYWENWGEENARIYYVKGLDANFISIVYLEPDYLPDKVPGSAHSTKTLDQAKEDLSVYPLELIMLGKDKKGLIKILMEFKTKEETLN